MLARQKNVVPLVGSRRIHRLNEALGTMDVELSDAMLARIEKAVPSGAAAGTRYDAGQMAMLDSEKKREAAG